MCSSTEKIKHLALTEIAKLVHWEGSRCIFGCVVYLFQFHLTVFECEKRSALFVTYLSG